jgi:hypothetical protein
MEPKFVFFSDAEGSSVMKTKLAKNVGKNKIYSLPQNLGLEVNTV